MVLSLASQIVRRELSTASWRPVESTLRSSRFFHNNPTSFSPRKRNFFTSNAVLQQSTAPDASDEALAVQKRKIVRSPAGKRSLRRVAVEAQRTQRSSLRGQDLDQDHSHGRDSVFAVCVAEEFDMDAVVRVLRSRGYPIDPYGTGFLDEQVVHTREVDNGDIFIFPSGTVVSWSLPEDFTISLATETLLPAAINPHVENIEIEDLQFREDPSREHSSIKGDVVVLGTKSEAEGGDPEDKVSPTLAKIAFSSGLARSTKLAVLETSLNAYIASTRSIPTVLSSGGSRIPFSRPFILQKTGQLLSLRAQLNHYSELTDSLPDLFWDSRHELGLEGYYDQVGAALDVNVRIRTLNQKMDYAQEIASILRETLREAHSTYLEWIIIVLIAVEVAFELRRLWKERVERLERESKSKS